MSEKYERLSRPPSEALRRIESGRLRGKTDINPQWRYEAMDSEYGPCGIGWKYEIVRLWTEQGPAGIVFCFAQINVYTKNGESWSDPIPGIGGSQLVQQEKSGLHANDEGFKMAITDALSVALKMLGVAAAIYSGLWDGTKYIDGKNEVVDQKQQVATMKEEFLALVSGFDSETKEIWKKRLKFDGYTKTLNALKEEASHATINDDDIPF